METGTHSIWVSEQIRELGHGVIVANVRELRAISHSDRKGDTVDAEKIARYARLDPEILRPISHRTVAQQEALTFDSRTQPDRSSADGGRERGTWTGEALRRSSASFVHPVFRQAVHGRAAARSGSGARSSTRTDRCDDGKDQAL
jgi:hypothetical protein